MRPDGKHVAACSGGGFLSLVETSSGEMVFEKDLGHGAKNLTQLERNFVSYVKIVPGMPGERNIV